MTDICKIIGINIILQFRPSTLHKYHQDGNVSPNFQMRNFWELMLFQGLGYDR